MTPTTDMAAVVEALRSRRPVPRHLAREPRRRRARLAARDAPRAARARQGQRHGARRRGAAARRSTRSSTSSGHGLLRELPADAAERVLVAVDCAQETRLTDDRLLDAPVVVNVDHHHDNTRFGTANLVVDDASSTAEVLADVFAELGVALDAGDRRGALRGARHRHRPLPVREHDAEGAAARRRPARGRRGHPADLPGRLRVDAVREGEAARPRARPGHALRGGPGRRLVSPPRATSARWGRWSRTRKGSSTCSARSRARSSRR